MTHDFSFNTPQKSPWRPRSSWNISIMLYYWKKNPLNCKYPKEHHWIRPSIHPLAIAFILQGCKKALAEWGAPWAGYKSLIWLTQRDEQPITLTPVSNVKVSSYIICMFIACERKEAVYLNSSIQQKRNQFPEFNGQVSDLTKILLKSHVSLYI